MKDVILRLFDEWVAASDAAAAGRPGDPTLVARLEDEMCIQLERVGGGITLGQSTFTSFTVLIGKEKLHYFKVTTIREREHDVAADWTGYSFDRYDLAIKNSLAALQAAH